ncbi:MAG: hypothetical protein V1735_00320 [Nanoarchaeota archaeon]
MAQPVYDYTTQSLVPASRARYSPTWLRPDDVRLYRLSTPITKTSCLDHEIDFLSRSEIEFLQRTGGLSTESMGEDELLLALNRLKLLREDVFGQNHGENRFPLRGGSNPDLDGRVLVLGQFKGDEKDVLLPVVYCSKY